MRQVLVGPLYIQSHTRDHSSKWILTRTYGFAAPPYQNNVTKLKFVVLCPALSNPVPYLPPSVEHRYALVSEITIAVFKLSDNIEGLELDSTIKLRITQVREEMLFIARIVGSNPFGHCLTHTLLAQVEWGRIR